MVIVIGFLLTEKQKQQETQKKKQEKQQAKQKQKAEKNEEKKRKTQGKMEKTQRCLWTWLKVSQLWQAPLLWRLDILKLAD